MRRILVALGAVVTALAAGCVDEYRSPTQQAPTATPTPSVSASASAAAPTVTPQQHANAILDRAAAIRQQADNAMALGGTQEAMQVRQSIRNCRRGKQACTALAKDALQQSPVGSMVGLADYLTLAVAPYIFSRSQGSPLPMDLQPILDMEPDLPFAEELVKRATAEAQKIADVRGAEERQVRIEKIAIDQAAAACDAAPSTCKPKCEAGDAATCVVYGSKEWKGAGKLAEAKKLMDKACGLGFRSGCISATLVQKDVDAAAARVESLWSDVTNAGDDLVQKRHQTAMVSRMATNARMQQTVQRMQTINQAIVVERYCPARKAFIQGASAAEFQTRAAKHCHDEAPTGQGLSGAEVTLTADCQAVYATSCP